jgi:hypothetical protein
MASGDAFHRIKSMMLDESLFLWNKDSTKRLFIEVDACNEGWGACVYQYAEPKPPDVEDEGRHMLMSKLPKRVVEWVSKAWTEFEKELPVFYREVLARLLCLEIFRTTYPRRKEVCSPHGCRPSSSNKGHQDEGKRRGSGTSFDEHAHHPYCASRSRVANKPPRLSTPETRSRGSLWNQRSRFNGSIIGNWKCRFAASA